MRSLTILLSFFLIGNSFSKENCPNLKNRYSFDSSNSEVVDLGKLLNVNLINIKHGDFEINGDTNERISFTWKRENGEIINIVSHELKINKDYKCKDGWLVFSTKTAASRNNLPGLYIGDSSVRLSIDDLYDSLKIESTFKGREDITIFSYDSAHLSFLKWWGSKKITSTALLSTAPNIQEKPKAESEALSKVRKMFNESVLKGIFLVGLDEKPTNVLVTLKSFKASDLKTFESRLTSAAIAYKIKTEPVWTNNSYFLEILVDKY